MVDVVVCAVAPAAAISRTAIIRNTPETLVGISCSSSRRDPSSPGDDGRRAGGGPS
jgi:hypothetical protein